MVKKKLEEQQIVLCTVTKIVGTIVFVNIEDYNQEATIIFSEISPGRIRNIRDYAFPGKKIICKVLSTDNRGIRLSLRRVKLKERQEFTELQRLEKSSKAIIKTILKADAPKIIEKILEDQESLSEFLEDSKEDSKGLEKYIKKADAEKIIEILKSKKGKDKVLTKKFKLSSKKSDGIILIKKIIKDATKDCDECEVSYVAAGKYLVKIKSKDLKKAGQDLDKIINNIEEAADKNKCKFSEIKTKKD